MDVGDGRETDEMAAEAGWEHICERAEAEDAVALGDGAGMERESCRLVQ